MLSRLAVIVSCFALLLCFHIGYSQNDDSIHDALYDMPVDTFFLRAVPDSVVQKLQQQPDFAYANDPRYWIVEPPKPSIWEFLFRFFSGPIARIVIYTLMAAVILFALYRIVVMNKLFIFYSSRKVKASADVVRHNEIPDDLDEHIASAERAGNFRDAVRYSFLKALKMLNDVEWIRFHPKATNVDYKEQLRTHEIASEFGRAVLVYEYVWYGEFPLDDQQYRPVKDQFTTLYQKISN